ncbi:HAD family hydrolase [Verrucomicrobia bacterium]|nr:HAD family hydrolase [Verrucomicrobiota bacterium]
MELDEDSFIVRAINSFSSCRSIIIFDYDLTIARIPIDWDAAREKFRNYIARFIPSIKFKEGLRLDEMESLVLTDNPEKYKLIYSFREKIETEVSNNHEPIKETVNFLKVKTKRNYFVISNNLHSTVIAGLNQLSLLSSFVKVIGIDDVKSPKPSIKSLSLLGKSTNEIKNKSLFIGDSDFTDGKLCLNAKIPFINIVNKRIHINA